MDDFIVPGKPKKKGGVREIVDVPGNAAPIVKLSSGDLVVIGTTGLRFLVPGPYIIVPLDRWTGLLSRAIYNADPQTEESSRQVRRAQQREIIRDRSN
jgi:hypothetical protein